MNDWEVAMERSKQTVNLESECAKLRAKVATLTAENAELKRGNEFHELLSRGQADALAELDVQRAENSGLRDEVERLKSSAQYWRGRLLEAYDKHREMQGAK